MKAVFFCNSESVPDVYPPDVRGRIADMVELYPEVIRQEDMAGHTAALAQAEIVFSTWGMPRLTEKKKKKWLPSLRAVFYGAGSVQYFARPYLNSGVAVFSAWAANAVPVIEYASSLIQLSLKGFLPVQRMTRKDWRAARELAARYPGAYAGVKVGLVGAGMIGRGVIERLGSLDVTVQVYDPYCPEGVVESLGAHRLDDLYSLFATSQVVSNHTANLPSTREMLRYEHFAAMPQYGTFINTGRNSQVHVSGLVRALEERPDLTAFLDVTDPDEPPSAGNPLLGCRNVFMTPHIAGSMNLERGRQGAYMADECARWLAGELVRWQVTLKMLETMA